MVRKVTEDVPPAPELVGSSCEDVLWMHKGVNVQGSPGDGPVGYTFLP